jgi:hypothetical protein
MRRTRKRHSATKHVEATRTDANPSTHRAATRFSAHENNSVLSINRDVRRTRLMTYHVHKCSWKIYFGDLARVSGRQSGRGWGVVLARESKQQPPSRLSGLPPSANL